MSELSREAAIEIIIEAMTQVASDFDAPWSADEGEDTPILGGGAVSSITVVAAVMEVEQRLEEATGTSISLVSDSFLSASRSPLATVATFADFIVGQVRGV